MIVLLRQALRFGAVGMINTALGLTAIFAAMSLLGIGLAAANAIGYLFGLAVSFTLNRGWTFESRKPIAELLPKYLLLLGVSYLLNLGAVLTAVSRFSANAYLAQMLGVAVYTTCVFLGCRHFVFGARQEA